MRTAEKARQYRRNYDEKLSRDPERKAAILYAAAARVAKRERDLRASKEGWPLANWRSIRKRCLKHGIPFNISVSDLALPESCPVRGVGFVLGAGRLHPDSPSVDRLKPELGYVRGNVCVISWRANRLKSDCTDPDELRKVADYLELRI